MAKYWAIIVGINQYQSLQPLMYAQLDAIELRDFLIQEVGLPAEQCILLTDISPAFQADAAYPARQLLAQRLQALCQTQIEPTDVLWFFFSGYGVCWEGEDFLLLADADPVQIPETAVTVESVLKQLSAAPTDNIVVLLDMNRSQSALPDQRLGAQTLELAKSLNLSLLLSCQPDQFSQESLAVRHGLFTAALLEGLRYHGRLVLTQLADYAAERVPELCQFHNRPSQNPVAAIPAEKRFLLLLPPEAASRLPLTEADAIAAQPSAPNPTDAPPTSPLVPIADLTLPPATADSALTEAELGEDPVPGWQRWSLLAAGLLLLGVLVRNAPVFLGQPPTAETQSAAEPSPVAPPVEGASDLAPGQPLFPASPTSGSSEPALARAQQSVAEQKYGEALTWLNQVPIEQRTEQFFALLDQAQAGYERSQLTNEDVLNSARAIIEPVSPTFFSDAIKRARQVPAGDPYYAQAQQDIDRWSQVIIDLADGRAVAGQYDEAIAAVRLVPDDRGDIYQTAQARIERWQQQKINRDVLKQAQERLIPDNVETFENAIRLVKDIPAGFPERPIAEARIEQWSQDILVIARARAAEGRLEDAIAAAERVPQDTTAYAQAQQEIQTWQSQR